MNGAPPLMITYAKQHIQVVTAALGTDMALPEMAAKLDNNQAACYLAAIQLGCCLQPVFLPASAEV